MRSSFRDVIGALRARLFHREGPGRAARAFPGRGGALPGASAVSAIILRARRHAGHVPRRGRSRPGLRPHRPACRATKSNAAAPVARSAEGLSRWHASRRRRAFDALRRSLRARGHGPAAEFSAVSRRAQPRGAGTGGDAGGCCRRAERVLPRGTGSASGAGRHRVRSRSWATWGHRARNGIRAGVILTSGRDADARGSCGESAGK